MSKTLRALNIFGGPGAGKSTTVSDVFGILKKLDQNTEVVAEFAKQAIYQGHGEHFFTNYQTFIFGNQSYAMRTAAENVDFAITDSPLLMNAVYLEAYAHKKELRELIVAHHNHYESINIFLERTQGYRQEGRYQTETEAKEVDTKILDVLRSENIQFVKIPVDGMTAMRVVEEVRKAGWVK